MSHLIGELSIDDTHVVLWATGSDVEGVVGYLQRLTPLLKPTTPRGGLQAPLTWALITQLAMTFQSYWSAGPRLSAWVAEQAERRFSPPELTARVRDGAPPPRHYQSDGARLLASVGRAFLFDDPGTGKTLTTLLGILELRATGRLAPAAPIVVVCPNSVVDSWVSAVHTWTELRAVAWRGPMRRRARLSRTADVYVVAYSTARNDADPSGTAGGPLWDLQPGVVVVDECHGLKNRWSVQSQVVRKLGARAAYTFLLSGTPITHTVRDLWPGLATVEPAAYPSEDRYGARYVLTVSGDYDDSVLGIRPEMDAEFRMALAGQYRRLSKSDVLTELPDKVYSVRKVELPPEYRAAYDALESDMVAQIPGATEELSVMSVLAQLTRLSQLASAAADVWTTSEIIDGEYGPEEKITVHVKLRAPSWKADALIEILDERPGKQTAVFAPSAQLIRVAGELVSKAGYRVGYVIGGQKPAERTAMIDAFQAGELDVILVTTQAGGTGITLTAASTAVFLQRPWSYVESSQAEDRCHRIGSEIHDSIEIIDIVATNTVESRVRSVLRSKAGALAELLQDRRIVEQVLGGKQ